MESLSPKVPIFVPKMNQICTILLLLILSSWRLCDAQWYFKTAPGTQRTYIGKSATFTWTLNTTLDTSATIIELFYEDYSTVFYRSTNGFASWPISGYEERTDVVYTTDSVSFTLGQIAESDVGGPYGCRIQVFPDSYSNNNANLFLYATPNKPVLQTTPSDPTEGDVVTMTCITSSQSQPPSLAPIMTHAWTRDGQPLPTDRHTVAGGQLTIAGVLREDDQRVYTCTAQEDGSTLSTSTSTTVTVRYKPGTPILEGPDTTLVEGSSNLELRCRLTSDQAGNPASYDYRWWNTESDYTKTQNNVDILSISDVTVAEHDGMWKCEVSNTIGTGGQGDKKDINIDAPATITRQRPAEIRNLYSDEFAAQCDVRSKPGSTITWSYNGGSLPPGVTSQSSPDTPDGKYVISSSSLGWTSGASEAERRQATGPYVCVGDNGVGSPATSITLQLVVLYGPVDISLSDPGPITFVEGDSVSVTCSSGCSPSCSYQWTRASDSWTQPPGQTLSFSPVSRSHHGTYTCTSSNEHGEKSAALSITVFYATEITSFTSSLQEIFHGDSVTLVCSVTSRPDSEIIIENSTTPIASLTGQNATYSFVSISILDSGTYHCSARNNISQTTQKEEKQIDIEGGFHFCDNQTGEIKRSVSLDFNLQERVCQFANPSSPISKVNWTFSSLNETIKLTNLPEDIIITTFSTSHVYQRIIGFEIPTVATTHYGTYTMASDNGHGRHLVFSLVVTPEGPPDAPEALVCTRTTAVSIYLQWTAGYHGGADQTFEVTYTRQDTGGSRVLEVDGSGVKNGMLVDVRLTESEGIVSSVVYKIQVDARNEFGSTPGPSLTNRTLDQPSFDGVPAIYIDRDKNVAFIDWELTNQESASNMNVNASGRRDNNNFIVTEILDLHTTPYIVRLPEAESFTFDFHVYDGQDAVYKTRYEYIPNIGGPPVGIIVGCVVGVVAADVLATVVVVLWRKRKLLKKREGTTGTSPYYENTTEFRQNAQNVEANILEIQYENIGLSSPVDKQYDELIGSGVSKETNVYDDLGASHVENYEGLDMQNIRTEPAAYESFPRN